jgi:hypothetical protein
MTTRKVHFRALRRTGNGMFPCGIMVIFYAGPAIIRIDRPARSNTSDLAFSALSILPEPLAKQVHLGLMREAIRVDEIIAGTRRKHDIERPLEAL